MIVIQRYVYLENEESVMGKEKIICFGTGKIGKLAYYSYREDKDIVAYIDNDQTKWGNKFYDIPIIGFNDYLQNYSDNRLVITCGLVALKEIKMQLEDAGVHDYSLFEDRRERIVSFSNPHDREDLILYHVLKDLDNIFYIDVGSNDPTLHSVTKLLYDNRGAKGINIDPIKELIDKTDIQRSRDINICAGVSDTSGGEIEISVQGGGYEGSTFAEENVADKSVAETRRVPQVTLKEICDKYIDRGQDITFLKVDVEGFEKEVLQGADFKKYRPYIIVMESTEPNTMISNHEKWEKILTENRYQLAYTCGVNRYYVSDEKREMRSFFLPIEDLLHRYDVYDVQSVIVGR